MPGLVLRAVVEDGDGEVWVAVETTATVVAVRAVGCGRDRRVGGGWWCGMGGRPVRLGWSKRPVDVSGSGLWATVVDRDPSRGAVEGGAV